MTLLKKIWKLMRVSHISFFVIVGLFIYLGTRADIIGFFNQFIQNDIPGVVSFITLFTIVTVLAPLTALPLVIPASAIFGPFFVSIYSILGWTLGAMIAFLIARNVGKPFLTLFISLEKIESYDKYLSDRVEFWGLVLLRMVLPVDLLSYAVGMLTRISFKKYMAATIVGIVPFAFAFAYIGDAFMQKQYILFIGLILTGIFIFLYILYKINKMRSKKENT